MIEHEADRNEMYQRAAAHIERGSRPVATPDRTPQRESGGQFAPAERATGLAGLERDAGYKPLKDDDREEIDSDRISIRDAANDRAKELQERPIEVHESGLDEKITLSAEQAAKRVAEAREADAAQAELDGTKAAQKAVDDLRGEQPAEVRQPAQIEAEPDIERVLSHPKVRDAISAKVTEAETQRAEYELGLQNAWKAQLGAIGGDFPELANIPHTQWVAAINNLAQTDLPKAKQIAARLHSLAQLEAAAIQLNAQKDSRAKAEFTQYSARENQRFKELTKNIPAKEMSAIAAHIPTLLAESGVRDPRQFLQAIQGQTTFPRASAEALLIKAAKYDMMQKAARAQPARAPLPPVARPGVAAPRGNSASTALAALNQKLSQTGDIKDAVKYLTAKRKATKR